MLILETYLANGFSSRIFYQLLKIMPFLVCINYKWWFFSIVIFERGRCFWLFFFSLTGRKKKNKVCTLFAQLLIFSSFLILFSVTWATFLKKNPSWNFLEGNFPPIMWLSTLQNAHLFSCIALFHWVLCCFSISGSSFFFWFN